MGVTHGKPDHDQHPVADRGHPAAADSAGSAGSSPVSHTYASELHRLKSIEQEYRITLRVVACLAELVSLAYPEYKNGAIEIADQALADAPELRAWRDDVAHKTMIQIER